MRSAWGRTVGLYLGAGSKAAARAWSLPSSLCTASVMLSERETGGQLVAAGWNEELPVQAPAGGGLLCITRCGWGNSLDPAAGGSGAHLPGFFSVVQKC